MKRAAAFSFLLACCGVLLGDSPNPGPLSRKPATLLEDLVRLTKGGSSDVTVLAYAKAHRLELPPEVSGADLRWLRNSGVSETVVRYMTAFDVRASGEGVQEDVAYGSYEDAAHPRAAYSYPEVDYDSYRGSYPDSYDDAYPAGYDYDYYPSYGYGYYPYPLYFFVDHGGFFGRFHRRNHRFGGHRRFDGGRGFRGHRGGVVGHGGFRDPWRERGFGGRKARAIVVGPRGSGRPAFARGGFGTGFQGPRGRAIGHRGFGPPGSARSGFPHGFGGPRGGVSGPGGFSHPGFSRGPHTGGGFSRSPLGISGGGRVVTGPRGGRGRR
jgi:hypothetical protein